MPISRCSHWGLESSGPRQPGAQSIYTFLGEGIQRYILNRRQCSLGPRVYWWWIWRSIDFSTWLMQKHFVGFMVTPDLTGHPAMTGTPQNSWLLSGLCETSWRCFRPPWAVWGFLFFKSVFPFLLMWNLGCGAGVWSHCCDSCPQICSPLKSGLPGAFLGGGGWRLNGA